MKLSFEAIKRITAGTSYINKNGNYIQFHRFSRLEEKFYKNAQYPRHYTTSGVRLNFCTNSTSLKLKVRTEEATPTRYFAHDIFVDGEKVGSISNFSESDLPIKFDSKTYMPLGDFSLGDFEGEFSLGEGIKEVCIVFPWSVNSMLESLELDDGAVVKAINKPKKIISYGDSITYGASAVYPSNRYISKIADALDAEEICKAVGGEIFCPALLSCAEGISAEYVTVAYGTNDMYGDFEAFKVRCSAFFENISKVYPDSTIFAISPIWRTDCKTEDGLMRFKRKENFIKETTSNYKNVVFISGYDLVPHKAENLADLYLHPNDDGFKYYAANLLKKIRRHSKG